MDKICIILINFSYIEQAKLLNKEIRKIVEFTKINCKKIEIVGEPKICVVAFSGFRINSIYDKMHEKKWEVSYTAKPVGFHFCLTVANIHNLINNNFINDLKDSYDYVYIL